MERVPALGKYRSRTYVCYTARGGTPITAPMLLARRKIMPINKGDLFVSGRKDASRH